MIGAMSLSAMTDEMRMTAVGSLVPSGREISLEGSECRKWKNLPRILEVAYFEKVNLQAAERSYVRPC